MQCKNLTLNDFFTLNVNSFTIFSCISISYNLLNNIKIKKIKL